MGDLKPLEITNLRVDYTQEELNRDDLHPNPFKQFTKWFDVVLELGTELEPNAMTLATVSKAGIPDARILLMKGMDERGFAFYTNYASQKGQDLLDNPQATILFYWGALHRQVRITGEVSRVTQTESALYFRSRPHGSQLGAWASQQSQVIESRAILETKLKALQAQYPEGTEVPLPETWGGYRLVPTSFEFWQGRQNRLHDRFRYTRQANDSWIIDRLSP